MASKEFETLERRLDVVIDSLTNGVEGLIEELVETIGRTVVDDTPVDTGFARANWRPSINAPTPNPISFLDPTGNATISRINTIARLYKIGDQVFITNRAPYIEQLNSGSSKQAPPDFVAKAIRRSTDFVLNKTSSEGIL